MNKKMNTIILSVLIGISVFSGCGGSGDGDSTPAVTTTTTSLSGVAQKGAYVKDSNVSLCKLDAKMACTEEKLEAKVSDNNGSYEFKTLPWSGLSRLSISGYYFDEVTGKTSLSPATITAIVDIKSNVKQKSNTNILTDFRAKRMKKLVDAGKSTQEAEELSQEDVKKLFNIKSDDFTALNILDFSAGKASVNAELLRLSTAIAKSTNPVGDLEALMKIYNEGGLAAVLDSSLYKKLMKDAGDVDVKETLTSMGMSAEAVNAISDAELTFAPFARARMSTQKNNQVIITLFGTKFTSLDPSLGFSVEGGNLAVERKSVSDDNSSVVLDMNASSACKDINLTFTVEYMDLENVSNPLRTNQMVFSDPIATCNDTNGIVVPTNQPPLAIIGMEYLEVEQEEQNITAYVGERVLGLESSYSHDRDPYPFGGITHCQWEYNGVIVKESNDTSCNLDNLVFDMAGVYDYKLTVTDKAGATDSNIAHITIIEPVVTPVNHAPTVSISPSGDKNITINDSLTLNANANDEDADVLSITWKLKKLSDTDFTQVTNSGATGFNYTFDTIGTYLVVVEVEDTNGSKADANITVSVADVPSVVMTLDDINISVGVKEEKNFAIGFTQSDSVTIFEMPIHGSTEAILVGNETWHLDYESTNCYVGQDSFIYKVGSDYGRVNVTINAPSLSPLVNRSHTLYNNETLSAHYLASTMSGLSVTQDVTHGSASVYEVGGESVYYTYDPDDTYVGADYFDYNVSQTINECPYSQTGRIHFIVNSLAPVVTTPTQADLRTLLSSDNPKDGDQFGSGVAIEGDTVVVGIPGAQIDGTGSHGEVIIYQKTDNGADVIQHIQNPDLQESGIVRHFGHTISLKDGLLAVVAPGMQTINNSTTIYSDITKVYVYKQEDNKSFSYIQTFDAITNNSNSYFAYNNIAINKNYLVIGAHNETVNEKSSVGAAYVYAKDGESFGTTPIRLSDANLTISGGFAKKVVLMDDLILVNMTNKKVYEAEGDTTRYGAVYVYKDNGSGIELASVINSPKIEVDNYTYTAGFGTSLAVDGNMLAIGIPNATVNGLVAVGYVDTYMRSGDTFTLLSRISDPSPVAGENFGNAVAIENPYLVVSSSATSNSDATSKAETVQVYQYSGEDSNYTKLDEFEHIPTHRTWLKFKERPSFGTELDISDGVIIASAEYAYEFSRLGSRSYRAGKAYLYETDMQRPYWVDYKRSIIQSDNNSYYNAKIIKPDTYDYVSSGVGSDSALFTYDMEYINYGVMSGDEGEGGANTELDFYTPNDANSDNKYEVDMKITYNGLDFIYPFTWEVKDSMHFTEGHNDGVSFFHTDYNRLQLTGVGTLEYASELLFEDAKVYVFSSDKVYSYSKNDSVPELLVYDAEVSIDDVVATSEINVTDDTSFYKGSLHSFDVDGSKIATMSKYHRKIVKNSKNIYETDSYIHLFNDSNYLQSIVVHRDSQNIYPCEDEKVCSINHKTINGVQLEKDKVFVAYSNQKFYHDDNLTGYKEWETEYRHNESGVIVYDYNGTDYEPLQVIAVPANSNNASTLKSFQADGDFLLVNGSHDTDEYYNPNSYIRVYKFDGNEYVLLQSFTLATDAGRNWKASLENGYLLIENQRAGYTNLDTYIYQYSENSDNFVLIDTITNEEAGATYVDAFKGIHIQVSDDGAVYLFKRFYKRLETRDATTDFVANAAYIGVFRQDKTTHKFRFVDSFTHRDGSNSFADAFAVDGDTVVANTGDRGYLHSFKLTR